MRAPTTHWYRLPAGLLLVGLLVALPTAASARRSFRPRVKPGAPPALSIVFPAHNEARSLPRLVREWSQAARATGRPFELIVVNDASTDRTRFVLRRLQRRNPQLTAVNLKHQTGQSGAILAGFARARAKVIAYADGDGQIDPAGLKPLLAKIDQGYDVANGRRRLAGTESRATRLGSWTMNKLRQLITGDRLKDGASGFKIMRRAVIDQLPGTDRFPKLHRFFAPIAAMQGFSVTEVPIDLRPREHGSSHYGLKRLWGYAARDFPALRRYRKELRGQGHGQGQGQNTAAPATAAP